MIRSMAPLKARVRNGRLTLNEPTNLPEGTEIEFTVADEGDNLDEQERVALHEALERSWSAAKAGNTKPAKQVLRALKTHE
jgi:hypothetical protein